MIRKGILSVALASAALLAGGNFAQASFMFDYSTELTDVTVNTGPAGSVSSFGKSVTYDSGTGTTLTFEGLDGTNRNALPATNTLFGDISVASTDDTLRMYDLGFTFSYVLNDRDDAGTSADPVTFSGRLVGSVAETTTNLSFVSFVPGIGVPTTVEDDGDIYTVTMTAATPPDQEFTGRLAATVTAVPEPMSMALMGIGGAAAFALFKRRRLSA